MFESVVDISITDLGSGPQQQQIIEHAENRSINNGFYVKEIKIYL